MNLSALFRIPRSAFPVPMHLLAAIPLLAASAALAQTDTVNVGGVNWKPVDQGHADRGPLSFSLRDTRVDLRQSMDFDRVYQLDSKPRLFAGAPTSSDYYMRMSGALTAVFPRSSYTTAGKGVEHANIPAGTIFSIGGPISKLVGTQPDKSTAPKKAPSSRIDQSAPRNPPASASQPANKPAPEKARPDKPNAATPPPPAKEPERTPAPRVVPAPQSLAGTIWNNEELRKQRVGALLDEAAKSNK
jgi:hypothetical protein